MARKWLPDNVTEWKDRHGKPRYRWRKKGHPTHNFKSRPGTPEFMEELARAKTAIIEPEARWAPYSYDALAVDFFATTKWIETTDSTKRTYRNIINRWREANGHVDVRRVRTADIDKKLVSMKDTPAAANNLRKVLARLHRHAVRLGWRADNPVEATDPFKKGKGFHCWTESELDAFDKQWPLGTRERLAKELMLNTALRKSDALAVGPKNRIGNRLHLRHSKNDSDTIIPITPALMAALGGVTGDPYIQTQFGKPFTSTGFYNWFKRACVAAGIPHCSPHGLRKAISRQLAESGATVLEGRAVTGHKTDREFMKYAEAANKERMADKAMANLNGKPPEQNRKTSEET